MKENPRRLALQSQGLRPQPSNIRRLPSSFRLLRSAFCLLLTAYCLLPSVLNAQGCAMCYTSASAARAGAKEALANGVLILLVPPMLFFAMIAVVVYIYRNKFRETSVVPGPLSFVRGPWFAGQDAAFATPQENGLRVSGEFRLLDEDDRQPTKDNGPGTKHKHFRCAG